MPLPFSGSRKEIPSTGERPCRIQLCSQVAPRKPRRRKETRFWFMRHIPAVFSGARRDVGVTVRTVAETGFRWWLRGGEHTRVYYPSPHPSLCAVSFPRPRTGWNGRNWGCLSVARLTHAGPQASHLLYPGKSPGGLGEARAGKECPWAVSKLPSYSSGTHSECPSHPKRQLVHSSICKKAEVVPTVCLFCP